MMSAQRELIVLHTMLRMAFKHPNLNELGNDAILRLAIDDGFPPIDGGELQEILVSMSHDPQTVFERHAVVMARRNEIAWRFLLHERMQRGMKLSVHTVREIGNVAKTMELNIEDAVSFAKELVDEIVSLAFNEEQGES